MEITLCPICLRELAEPSCKHHLIPLSQGGKGDVTFTGTFQFDGGLNLNCGTVTGGNNVTVKTQVYRTELGFVNTGALVYSGNVNLVYTNRYTAAAIILTTGLEWPTGLIANIVDQY